MKHTNSKFFIMFLAGILFSAVTVFAATINVSTNFTSNAVQFLQELVVTDSNGATGVVLNGDTATIQSDTICETDGSNCKNISDILTGYNESDPIFMTNSGSFLKKDANGNVLITGGVSIYSKLTVGHSSLANGSQSVAMGNGSTANGDNSISMGDGTTASGDNSISMGQRTSANGSASTAMGQSGQANGAISTAMGSSTIAKGLVSTAMGRGTQAKGKMSTAMGYGSEAHGAKSTAMGYGTYAYGENSVAMGRNTITATGATSSLTIGKFNTPIGNALFVIGNGDDGNRGNAMVVLDNGDIGMGVDEPKVNLHLTGSIVVGDDTTRITGAIRFNGTNFVGRNGEERIKLDV